MQDDLIGGSYTISKKGVFRLCISQLCKKWIQKGFMGTFQRSYPQGSTLLQHNEHDDIKVVKYTHKRRPFLQP